MALDQVVQNAAGGLQTNNQVQQQIGAAVIAALIPDLVATVSQIETQLLNPNVNTQLGDSIYGVVVNAGRYGLDPLQWYNQLVGIYRQPMFGYGLGNGNLVYAVYLLSSLYVNLQRSRDRNAQIYRNIFGNLLAEALYYYYQSIGQSPSKQLIRAYIDQFANAFNGGHMGALNLVYSTALLRTWDPLFALSSSKLISTLDDVLTSTIQNLTNTMYSKVQIPQVVALILKEFGQNGLYTNMFDYIFNRKINGYIAQIQQQFQQPAGQAGQGGQPLPQQLGQQQGGQGNNPLGQQAQPLPLVPAQQGQQANQPPLVQVPPPHKIRPQNQQKNQQNNQQGQQTP
jgi:hypothetical protein